MLLLVIVLLIGFGNSGIIWAQETSEDSGLEEVLSGFDDEPSNDENDVLSGFDDRTDESGSDKDTVDKKHQTLRIFPLLQGISF